jgi:hypothetical protein
LTFDLDLWYCDNISEDVSITSGIEKSDSENTLRSENSERQNNESMDEFNIKSKTFYSSFKYIIIIIEKPKKRKERE